MDSHLGSGGLHNPPASYHQPNRAPWSRPLPRKEYVAKNREAVNEYQKAWRARNKDKVSTYNREYVQKHGRPKKAYKRRSPRDPKLSAAYCRRWRRKNPEALRVARSRRRALEKSALSTLTTKEWQERREEFGGLCAYCMKPANTLDHVVPLSKGGTHTLDNVVPACGFCNSSKRDKSLLEFVEALAS